MAVINIKTLGGEIFIPTESDAYGKIIITADDSTQYTVMDTYSKAEASNYTIDATVVRNVTDKISRFTLTLSNVGGVFLDKFDGGEVIEVYSDNTDATTLIFRGRIDNVKYGLDLRNGFTVNIDGRDYPELKDKGISGILSAELGDNALAKILYNEYSDITLTYWNGSTWCEATHDSVPDTTSWSPSATGFPTERINMAYQDKKGWAVVGEICKRVGLDCYLEYDSGWKLRVFVAESIANAGVSIAYGVNLLGLTGFGIVTNNIVNRVSVYGKTEGSVILLKTENDTTSQNDLWIKDKIMTEGSALTMDDVQDKADFELAEGINVDNSGTLNTLFMPTLKPGDVIYASVPYCKVDGNYKAYSFTHRFGDTITTSIQLVKKEKHLEDYFQPRAEQSELASSISSNPQGMKNSYTLRFDESISLLTHDKTEESDGKLVLQAGETDGEAITTVLTTDEDVEKCELRRQENYYTGDDSYYIRNKSTLPWEEYTGFIDGDVHEFESPGNQLALKIVLTRTASTAPSPGYDNFAVLYR